jgi:hypothetical protein
MGMECVRGRVRCLLRGRKPEERLSERCCEGEVGFGLEGWRDEEGMGEGGSANHCLVRLVCKTHSLLHERMQRETREKRDDGTGAGGATRGHRTTGGRPLAERGVYYCMISWDNSCK